MPWEPIQPLALAVDDRPSGTPRPDRLYRPPVSHHVHVRPVDTCTSARLYSLFYSVYSTGIWLLWVCHYVFMCLHSLAPSFLPSPGGAVTRIPESKRRRYVTLMSAVRKWNWKRPPASKPSVGSSARARRHSPTKF